MSSFNVVVANDLEEIQMIAGDDKTYTYNVYDDSGSLLDLNAATCSVSIFRYGDPTNLLLSLTGVISASPLGQFTAEFPSSSSINLSGVYQQQPKIIDYLGRTHIPSQGKIIIFPSPSS